MSTKRVRCQSKKDLKRNTRTKGILQLSRSRHWRLGSGRRGVFVPHLCLMENFRFEPGSQVGIQKYGVGERSRAVVASMIAIEKHAFNPRIRISSVDGPPTPESLPPRLSRVYDLVRILPAVTVSTENECCRSLTAFLFFPFLFALAARLLPTRGP